MSQAREDHGPEYRHVDDMAWETLRFPGQHSKMIFHPRPERPTAPNTGFVRYEPGAFHPRHRHDFAQVWYILEGTFTIGERTCGPGTVVFHPDPHFEEDLSTESGGLMFFVQYTGPDTGKGPIYDGRFNMKERRALSEETSRSSPASKRSIAPSPCCRCGQGRRAPAHDDTRHGTTTVFAAMDAKSSKISVSSISAAHESLRTSGPRRRHHE